MKKTIIILSVAAVTLFFMCVSESALEKCQSKTGWSESRCAVEISG